MSHSSEINALDYRTDSLLPVIKFSFPCTTNDAPLAPGTHYLAIENTNNASVRYGVRVDFGFGIRPGDTFNFTGAAQRPADDATTNTTIFVPNDRVVAGAQVSLHMDYPRMS